MSNHRQEWQPCIPKQKVYHTCVWIVPQLWGSWQIANRKWIAERQNTKIGKIDGLIGRYWSYRDQVKNLSPIYKICMNHLRGDKEGMARGLNQAVLGRQRYSWEETSTPKSEHTAFWVYYISPKSIASQETKNIPWCLEASIVWNIVLNSIFKRDTIIPPIEKDCV